MKIARILTAASLTLAVATTSAAAVFAAPASAADQTKITNIKTRGDQEISRRLTTLNTLNGKINDAIRLTASDKSALQSQINAEISGLTALKTKLDADTDLATTRADAQSIVNEYRVYVLIVPKVAIIRYADSIAQTNAKLSTLAGKLQTRITDAKNAGKDVSGLQSQLDQMNQDIIAANTTASTIESKVVGLQPTDYNSDHTILSGDRDQLNAAHQQNLSALNLAKQIAASLKTL